MTDSLPENECGHMADPMPQVTNPASWSIGIVCLDSRDIASCARSLTTAGFRGLRLFVNRHTIVPPECSHIPVTVLNEEFSPQASERFIVAEMLMRTPAADLWLLLSPNVDMRGIEQWSARVHRELAVSPQATLFADSQKAPRLIALTLESGKAFLSDYEGLVRSLERPVCSHVFGAELWDWAHRTGWPVRTIALANECSTAEQADESSASQDFATETAGKGDPRITLSGASVSIVVPNWNCGKYLAACLDSLLRQTVAAEVIVVDDASTDESRCILDSFGDKVTVVAHAHRRGANAARNTGLAAAKGDFIAFADADNEYAPVWIEELLQAILANPSAAVAYCGYAKQAGDGPRAENRAAPWDLDRLWFGNYIDMSSLVRRSAIPLAGLQEGFRPFDDWRLWLKLAQHGWQGVWVPRILFVKHVRNAGKTEQSLANLHERASEIVALRREFSGLVGLEKPVSVVIPACGGEDVTARCLAHLGDYCGVPFHVIYVDNGSPVTALDVVAQAAEAAGASIRIIRNLENRGFTYAVNQGIAASGEANVLILNNDCFIGPGCVENLARELRLDDRVAAAGPLTGDEGQQSLRNEDRRRLLQWPDDLESELEDPVRVSFRLGQHLRASAEPVLSFFCALLSHEALARCGGLDSRFSSGLAADDEWCFRVRNRGYEVRLVLNAYAAHLHKSSFKRLEIDRDSLQREAQALLHRVLAAGGTGKEGRL